MLSQCCGGQALAGRGVAVALNSAAASGCGGSTSIRSPGCDSTIDELGNDCTILLKCVCVLLGWVLIVESQLERCLLPHWPWCRFLLIGSEKVFPQVLHWYLCVEGLLILHPAPQLSNGLGLAGVICDGAGVIMTIAGVRTKLLQRAVVFWIASLVSSALWWSSSLSSSLELVFSGAGRL